MGDGGGLGSPRAAEGAGGVAGRAAAVHAQAEIGALAAQSDGWQRVALLLLGATGCRIGEIADLCWAQVDLSGARVTVSGKTGERVVPLGAGIVATLREWRMQQPGERVWPAVSAGQGLRLALRQGCRDLGIAHVTPHGLRPSMPSTRAGPTSALPRRSSVTPPPPRCGTTGGHRRLTSCGQSSGRGWAVKMAACHSILSQRALTGVCPRGRKV